MQFLGQYLLSRGLISAEALDEALDYQESVNLPLGALALDRGILSEKQLLHVHAHQRQSDQRFGEIAVRLGFMTRTQLDELLREQKEARIFLGEALVQRDHLTREQLDEALADYHTVQEQAEARVQRDLRNLSDYLLVAPSIQLTTRMLLRLAEMVVKVAAISQDTRLAPKEYVLWQEVSGDRAFTYAMACDAPDLLDLAESLLAGMVDDEDIPTEVDELALDAGKEFINIVVGHICTWLSREGLNTMPLPPDAAEGDAAVPVQFEGPVRRINVSLTSVRGDLALSLLVPAAPAPE